MSLELLLGATSASGATGEIRDFMAISQPGTAGSAIYSRQGDEFTKLANSVTGATNPRVVGFSKDGNQLITYNGSTQGAIFIHNYNGSAYNHRWNLPDPNPDKPNPMPASNLYVNDAAFNGDLLALSVGTPYSMMRYQREGTQFVGSSGLNITSTSQMYYMGFSPDGKYLFARNGSEAVGFGLYAVDGSVLTQIPINPAIAPINYINWTAAFSPDSTLFVTTSGTTSPYGISIYRISDGQVTRALRSSVSAFYESPMFSPDGTHLLVGQGAAPFCKVYDATMFSTSTVLTEIPIDLALSSRVTAMAFSQDGVHLAIGTNSDPYLQIYRRDGSAYTKLPLSFNLTARVVAIAFHRDPPPSI